MGSAILNILCNGGPIAVAERLHAFLAYHGLDPEARRYLEIGFAARRFPYLNAPWDDHMASIQRAAGGPVLALIVMCGPDAQEATLLVGYSDGTQTSDPEQMLDAKEARDRGANKFTSVMTLNAKAG